MASTTSSDASGRTLLRRRSRRPHTFKFRVSAEERRAILERARGYSSPAEYARRTLVAGWSLPVHRAARVADAFPALQEVIDRAATMGMAAEAQRATEALREILRAFSD
jgi:hypothetical protein